MCLYDLQKGFEYPVLLERLFGAGVNGKMWQLLSSWHDGGSCHVKLDGRLSASFQVERGVKQGSVLLPTLYIFLLVMDPLLRQLQASQLALSVNRFYAKGFDDLRTFATSHESLKCQIAILNTFVEQNLNGNKCEIVLFSKHRTSALSVCEVHGWICLSSQ